MIQKALKYSKQGFAVFPCKGKVPVTKHGFKDATTDTETIKKWWGSHPTANIGIPTGRASGFFVVDIDGDIGEQSLRAIEKEKGQLPDDTIEVITGRGGRHIYFKMPEGVEIKNSAGKLGEGIDIRGDGGYVLVPPSIHPDTGKRYEYEAAHEGNRLVDAPQWLLELLKEEKPKEVVLSEDGKIPVGCRDDELFRTACSLKNKGMSVETIKKMLVIMRDDQCEDPQSITERDIDRIAKSAKKYPVQVREESKEVTECTDLPLSESAVSHMFNQYSQNNICYCSNTSKHMLWNGKYWESDERNRISVLLELFLGAYYQKAMNDNDKKLAAYFKSLMCHNKIQNIIKLSRGHITRFLNEFDQDKTLFNMQNCMFDVMTGQAYPHDKMKYMSKISNVVYDPAAKCPNWEKFIDKIFLGDKDLIRYIQKIIGYCLTSNIGYHAFFIFYGDGRNGKSTFVDTLAKMMGDYWRKIPSNSLMEQLNQQIPHDIATLNGTRMVIASESKMSRHLDESRIKELTGENSIQVRHLYQSYFSMPITFKIFLQTNNKPSIQGVDVGIWRRLKMIPFNYEFSDNEAVENYAEKYLYHEINGIFNWAHEGWRLAIDEGWREPRVVLEATNQYRDGENIIQNWIDDYCNVNIRNRIKTTELFEFFRATMKSRMTKKTFTEYMKKIGYRYEQGPSNFNYWIGITKKEEDYEREERPF